MGFFLWCISFGTFLVAQREKYIPKPFIAPFSPWREKGAQRAPPKGRTHGPPLWKPHPSSARACLSRVCAERNAVECGTSRCQVGASSVARNGVGATPVAVNLRSGDPRLIAKGWHGCFCLEKRAGACQRGRNDTRRGQPAGWRPKAGTQAVRCDRSLSEPRWPHWG